jgi:hypothetical protein
MNDDELDHNPGARDGDGRHLPLETLSAYADGQLPPRDREMATAHLANCASCQEELRTLRATTLLLRSLPEPRPARSFQLGPDYALERRTEGPRWLNRLLSGMPALRAATAAVAMLLLVVIAGDVLTNRNEEPSNRSLLAPSQAPSTQPVILPPAVNTSQPSTLFQTIPTETSSSAPPEAAQSVPQQKNAATGSQRETNAAADSAAANATESTETSDVQAAGAAAAEEAAPSPSMPTPTATASATPTATSLPTVTPLPTATAVPSSTSGTSGGNERNWRIAEITLAVVLAWLLVTWIGLERFRHD